jgi:Ca2+-binding RTX toxin-like protein
LIALDNYGLIRAVGHSVDIINEALALGGGVVNNYSGGVIHSDERAITVDNSDLGNAFGPITIYNEGTIQGDSGEAISITDAVTDTITNKGMILGSIDAGGGDDIFRLYTGSSIVGAVDGGDGLDTVNLLGNGIGVIGNLTHIEVVNLSGGDWTLGSEGFTAVNLQTGAQELRLAANTLADGHFDGAIGGFGNDDVLDLQGIGAASTATLDAGNVLTVSGGTGGPVTLQFDPGQNFSGQVFQVASDGSGGINVTLAKVVDGGNGDDAMVGTAGNDVIGTGNGNDTVNSGDGNDTVAGGNGNDILRSGNGNSVLDGAKGDDVLVAGNGNNVLTGGDGNDSLTVGNGNNDVSGGNGDDIFHFGTGNNTIAGGSGNDTFVFASGFGKDVISDFSHGDHIEFDGVFQNFQAVQAATHQVGADTVISVDPAHSITLHDVVATSLHASDFLLV